jgi:hypothetical protein
MGTATAQARDSLESGDRNPGPSNTANLTFSLAPLDPATRRRIEQLAYVLWTRRGRPIGSPETDWFQAEAIVRNVQSEQEAES